MNKPSKITQTALSCCLVALLLTIVHKVRSQDITAPRFFTFNVQSLSTNTSPVLPQNPAFIPTDQSPNFLYELALKFPIKLKGNTRLIGEIAHKNEFSYGMFSVEGDEMDDIEPLELFQTSGSFILQHKFNDQWSLTNLLNFRTNSNRTFNFDRNALRYTNASIIEKKTTKGNWGFGGVVTAHQRVTILPIIKYETSLNNKWGLDIFLPAHMLVTRNLNKSSRLLFGARGDAASYILANDDDLQAEFVGSNYRRISVNGIVGYERQITRWVGFSIEGGASFPYKSGIFDSNNPNLGLHNFQDRITPHFNVGFFLSLPN